MSRRVMGMARRWVMGKADRRMSQARARAQARGRREVWRGERRVSGREEKRCHLEEKGVCSTSPSHKALLTSLHNPPSGQFDGGASERCLPRERPVLVQYLRLLLCLCPFTPVGCAFVLWKRRGRSARGRVASWPSLGVASFFSCSETTTMMLIQLPCGLCLPFAAGRRFVNCFPQP